MEEGRERDVCNRLFEQRTKRGFDHADKTTAQDIYRQKRGRRTRETEGTRDEKTPSRWLGA